MRGEDRRLARTRSTIMAANAATRYPHIARALGSLPPTPIEIAAIRVGLTTWVRPATEYDGRVWSPGGQQTLG